MNARAHIERSARAGVRHYHASGNRIVATVLGDIKLIVDTNDFSLTPHLVMEGFWESWVTAWLMSTIRPQDRMLNIGANCGYFTMVAARAGAHVVAVEPQAHLAEGISLSAALNGWGARVLVEECVAGASDREVSLQIHKHLAGSAFATEDKNHEEPGWERVVVKEKPAHTLMPDANCAFIDAEGYEPVIWDGLGPLLKKKQLTWVAMEWSPGRYADPEGFLRSLREHGDLTTVMTDGRELHVNDAALLGGRDWDTLVVRVR